jgi:hypothetical protein
MGRGEMQVRPQRAPGLIGHVAAFFAVLTLLNGDWPALAQEAISQEEGTPSSVRESVTPIERSFLEKIPSPGLFPWVKEELKDADPFLRDTALDLNLRTYYLRISGPGSAMPWCVTTRARSAPFMISVSS